MECNHKPFHQKYRPKQLDELVGQEFISITLKQALLSNKIAPAYLFNGPRGTGKTSSARIFAKSLNCLSFDAPNPKPCGKCELCKKIDDGNALDIIEIDAASNTGVENIREIIEKARFSPTQARWKVYVIDECHMLSTAASNALLKTIEEPPSKVTFILATTNPERVLTTIHSRCQKFDFKRISANDIFQHLSLIANKESINFQDQALKLIAKRSNGGMRDAQSLLDQLSLIPNGITTENVQNLLGEVSAIDLINLVNSLINNDSELLLVSCNKLYDAGNEPYEIIIGLLNITRDLLLNTSKNQYLELYYTPIEFKSELDKFSKNLNKSRIIDWHNKLKNVEYQIKTSDNPRLWLEIHLTSLIEIKEIEKITNKQIISEPLKNTNLISENNSSNELKIRGSAINLKKDQIINKAKNLNNVQNQLKDTDSDSSKIVNDLQKSSDINNDNKQIILKEKWEQILSKIELPSTRMLLSQQAELESFSSGFIEIALAPNWENMIKSRKVVIESAIKKIFGDAAKLKFSSKEFNKNDSINNQEKIKKNNSQSLKDKPQKNILDKELPREDFSKESSKNLANFFNGEIIDLEE